MSDYLVRATVGGVRIYAVDSTNLVEDACARHGCWPLAAAALGRTMTGALLLSATFKDPKERLTIKVNGDGPLGKILVDAGGMTVRGYVDNPQADLPSKNGKIDVGGGVGKGDLVVTRFTGLKAPFSGSSELVSGEIAEDLTNYLLVSEQTSSSVALGVLVGTDGKVRCAGGFFVQAMPDADDDTLSKLAENISGIPPVTVMLEDGLTPEDIIAKVCVGLQPTIHDKSEVSFQCSCSLKTVEDMLTGLPKEELLAISEDENTEIICHFCGNKYYFTKDEIKALGQG